MREVLQAGVAQLVEQLICNQQVGGSNPSTSSTKPRQVHTEEYPSGQRGQTVNLLAMPTMVRIHPPPPRRSKLCIACSDLFYNSEYAHAAAPPFQLRPTSLGSQLACRPAGGVFPSRIAQITCPFQLGASGQSPAPSFFLSWRSSPDTAAFYRNQLPSFCHSLGPVTTGFEQNSYRTFVL